MPISDARRKANKKWNDANMKERYDRIQLVVPKGKKDVIRAHAESKGESVNAFINRAINNLLEREGAAAAGEVASGRTPGDDSGITADARTE